MVKRIAAVEVKHSRVTILPVTVRGAVLGKKIAELFPEAELFSPGELKAGGLKRAVRKAWPVSDAIIFICASGIAVRTIAPLLKSKATDPAVLVADETGNFVISLVSGHLGGANELTRRVSSAIGARPVITTATDSYGLPCIEEITERFGLAIENIKRIKVVNTAILENGPVVVVDTDAARCKAMKKFVASYGKRAESIFSFKASCIPSDRVRAYVFVTPEDDFVVLHPLKRITMLLRPREYVAGVGCRRGVSAEEVGRVIRKAMKGAGVSPLALKGIATIDIKRDEEGLLEFVRNAGVGIEFFSAVELNSIVPVSASSPVVYAQTGAKAVAEPAALISAKTDRLCQEKIKSKRVTVALAKARSTL